MVGPMYWKNGLLLKNSLMSKLGPNGKFINTMRDLLKINNNVPKLQFHCSRQHYSDEVMRGRRAKPEKVTEDTARLKRIEELTKRLGLDKEEEKPFWKTWIDTIKSPFMSQTSSVPISYDREMKNYSMKNVLKHVESTTTYVQPEPTDAKKPTLRPMPDFTQTTFKSPKMKMIDSKPPSKSIEEQPFIKNEENLPKLGAKEISRIKEKEALPKWGVKEVSRTPDGTQIVKFSPIAEPDFGKIRQYLLFPEESQPKLEQIKESPLQADPLPKSFDDDLLLCSKRKNCGQPKTCQDEPKACQDCVPRNSRYSIEKKKNIKTTFFTKFNDLKKNWK